MLRQLLTQQESQIFIYFVKYVIVTSTDTRYDRVALNYVLFVFVYMYLLTKM